MKVVTDNERVDIAQREAFDRILENHMLYCTVCDNNNQNCTVHNTTAELDGEAPVARVHAQAVCEGHVESLLSL